jgi:hypothetical protein
MGVFKSILCISWPTRRHLNLILSTLPTSSVKVSRHLPNVAGFIGQFALPILVFFLRYCMSGYHDVAKHLLKVMVTTNSTRTNRRTRTI